MKRLLFILALLTAPVIKAEAPTPRETVALQLDAWADNEHLHAVFFPETGPHQLFSGRRDGFAMAAQIVREADGDSHIRLTGLADYYALLAATFPEWPIRLYFTGLSTAFADAASLSIRIDEASIVDAV